METNRKKLLVCGINFKLVLPKYQLFTYAGPIPKN